MSESVGGALLMNIVIIIIAALIAVFTASFAYTKAYRAKTMIIDIIEDNGGYTTDNKEQINSDIISQLQNLGYRTTSQNCKKRRNGTLVYPATVYDTNTGYCVYEIEQIDSDNNKIIYYEVETFMHFDIPLFNVSIPVYGQTKSFSRQDNWNDTVTIDETEITSEEEAE